MSQELRTHLLSNRSCEQMAIVLCGVHRRERDIRLLGRHLVLMPPEAFSHQAAGGLTLRPEVQQRVLQLAGAEHLSQIDFHTHPGDGPHIDFSSIDDSSERTMATYLAERLPDTIYGSVVLNSSSSAARIWRVYDDEVRPATIAPPALNGSLCFSHRDGGGLNPADAARFARQIGAFGPSFQRRIRGLRVGLVGVGGLGSILVEELARLGVSDWVLVDNDIVEVSNLNRLLAATPNDVDEEIAKVEVARRNILSIDPEANVTALRCTAFTERALRALGDCHVLIAATDNDASRLVLNALSAQFLIPLVHVGVNLSVGANGCFEDISGEVAIPRLGSWCLLCAGIIDANRAAEDLARPEERVLLREHGYVPGVPTPAIYHLNGAVASMAVAEIHNLIAPYRTPRPYQIYREIEGELLSVEVAQTEGCLHCGTDGRLGLGGLVPPWRPKREPRQHLPAVLSRSLFEIMPQPAA